MSAAADSTVRYRERARAEETPARYSGWRNFAFTSVTALGVIGFALSRVDAPSGAALLTVPIAFLFANLVEYLAHKGPMHHPAKGPLAQLFKRHTGQHHRFFTHDRMAAESPADFYWVLFPPQVIGFFLGLIASPVAIVLFFVASANVAWLYVATAVGYYLTYEWLHWAFHQPEKSLVGRLPFIPTLRRHHLTHHDQKLMSEWNFNITFPIFDALFGTTWTPARAARRRR